MPNAITSTNLNNITVTKIVAKSYTARVPTTAYIAFLEAFPLNTPLKTLSSAVSSQSAPNVTATIINNTLPYGISIHPCSFLPIETATSSIITVNTTAFVTIIFNPSFPASFSAISVA